jgi:sortase A
MNQKLIIKICAVVSALSGCVIIFATLYPIVSYEWESAQKYPVLLSPLVDSEKGKFTFDDKDYTKAANWFDGLPEEKGQEETNLRYFTLSIPKLKIENATVAIGGDDLSDHLIQFSGTALPGRLGNSVIFGHSILPIYFNPENYLSIFSTLPKLAEGDLIYVNFDGINYKFSVENMFEVTPSDIQILEQNKSDSFLSLVTCTPPGHPLKPRRLIVRARIVDNDISLNENENSWN